MADFDAFIDRRGTDSLKWERYGDRDVIPLWVADMDFAAPEPVVAALQERVAHGVLGYTLTPAGLNEAFISDVRAKFQWQLEKEWLVWIPGLVSGLEIAARAVGNIGDPCMVFTPVYPPFLTAPVHASRRLVDLPLLHDRQSQHWSIDFASLEALPEGAGGHLLLCNPHNPVGRVFSRSELERLADLCLRKNWQLTSDEIHNGLLLDEGCEHICIGALSKEMAARTITLMAPSKTYNIAGLGCSVAIIPDRALRKAFLKVLEGLVPHVNVLGYVAAEAAYRSGEAWRQDLLAYLRGNYQLVAEMLKCIPALQLTPLEATYLAWIDCRALPVPNPTSFFVEAGVGLSDGADFGLPGFVRLNFGCTRALLHRALERMVQACRKVG